VSSSFRSTPEIQSSMVEFEFLSRIVPTDWLVDIARRVSTIVIGVLFETRQYLRRVSATLIPITYCQHSSLCLDDGILENNSGSGEGAQRDLDSSCRELLHRASFGP